LLTAIALFSVHIVSQNVDLHAAPGNQKEKPNTDRQFQAPDRTVTMEQQEVAKNLKL
jgi:hypothetical protein